ncbi:MAG: AAA family ATPase [Lachnospiraceae bacterium]|nr:AAA family ATPase [Lachnospiraceae bacterium]
MAEEPSVSCRVKSGRAVFPDTQKEMMTGMIAFVCCSDIEHYKDSWIWYPFIPRKGITFLLGTPGIGKSMFLMQIVAVLTGKTN